MRDYPRAALPSIKPGEPRLLHLITDAGILARVAPATLARAGMRYLIVNANHDAPAFFARAKSRGGHRVNVGVLFTWKR